MSVIDYSTDASSLSERDLEPFFVGWRTPPLPAVRLRILHSSYRVVVARDRHTQQVVGFVTAISDGVIAAYVPLIEVLPAFQRRGIGTELMRRVLDQLAGMYMVDLICDADIADFYAKLNQFDTAIGMVRRNYGALE